MKREYRIYKKEINTILTTLEDNTIVQNDKGIWFIVGYEDEEGLWQSSGDFKDKEEALEVLEMKNKL